MSIDFMKENGFTLKKVGNKHYYADYADDLVLLADTPVQAESLLHSLKQAGLVWFGFMVQQPL